MATLSRRSILRGIIAILWISTALPIVDGSGTVWVKLLSYDNPGGLAANGHCCDGRWGLCINACDYIFTICLDAIDTGNVPEPCVHGHRVSERIKNMNNVRFGEHFGGLQNPVAFHFPMETPQTLSLKVNVEDCDTRFNRNDFVDFLRSDISLSQAAVAASVETPYTLQSRTRLRVTVKVECSPHWYGVDCIRHCPPPGPKDHYFCNPLNGRKTCDHGWTGEECAGIDVCVHTSCGNGGTCVVYSGTELCLCPPGSVVEESTFGVTCRSIGTSPPQGNTDTPPEGDSDTNSTKETVTEIPVLEEIVQQFPNRPNSDCDTLAENGFMYQDGTYSIHVAQLEPFSIYCDMSDLGWTVIQRRIDGSFNFKRDWQTYKQGFGHVGVDSEYWMGLEKLHHLTTQRKYRLRISMQIGNGEWRQANYDHFWVESETHKYRLHVEGYHGNAGNALEFTGSEMTRLHNGMAFSTYDQDNDNWQDGNCAEDYQSGWWFNNCFKANLNGPYIKMVSGWPHCKHQKCISWKTIPHYSHYSLRQVVMKVLPQHKELND